MVTVQLLGGACLRAGDTPLTGPPAQRHRIALLALTVASWPQPLARDRAMALLWPERSATSARRLLNLAVHVLRTALGDAAITSTGDALLFEPGSVCCDLHELRVASEAGEHERVTRLYAGPLLDGFHLDDSPEFAYWLDERRAELAHVYAGSLLALAERWERAGDGHAWVGACRKLVAADPYSGQYALLLMRALDAAGDRGAAIQHAREHAQRLRAELDLEPDSEVVALKQSLRSGPARRRPISAGQSVEPAVAGQWTATTDVPVISGERISSIGPVTRHDSAINGKRRVHATWPGRRVAAVALAAVLGVVAYGAMLAHRGVDAPPASTAVLPFVDLSPGHDQRYFSDGLSDELITTLGKVPGLRVAARTSSFQFKGSGSDVHDVARRLGVGTVIEGSVRRSGNRLRVSAQLIDARNGYQLWTESYDRDMADVFAVQEDVARSIVAALRLRLAPAPDAALATRPTRDLEAYDLYLKGLFAWNQRTGPALRDAVSYLERAVARDSTFARAWGALANAYLLQYPYGGGGSLDSNWTKARRAASRALALDPTSAEAYTALGYGNTVYGWSWAAAEENFRRAIAAEPNYAIGHHWYGDYLAGRGRLDESEAEFATAHRLDPLSRQIEAEWGWVAYERRRNGDAESRIRQTLELDPNYAQGHLRLGFVEIQQHRYREAIASIERSIELDVFEPYADGALAYAYAASGDRARALALVHDLERRHAAGEFIPPFAIAAGYAGLGDTAHGIAWLNRGIDERDIYMPENFFDPLLDPLRSDPGYARVVTRMGVR